MSDNLPKVGVLFVHGVGMEGENYADDSIQKLKKLLGENTDNVAFHAYCWQPFIEPREQNLEKSTKTVFWKIARRMVVSYGGDAICYQPRHGVNTMYQDVHKGLADALQALSEKVSPDGQFIIVAHSLGTVIINNFIWDNQNAGTVGAAAAEPINRLKAIYTVGSPIAIWSLRYEDGGMPIKLNDGCVWRNIYSPTDVIGWPIKGINDAYGNIANLTDYRMWVGNFWKIWPRFTPMSHLEYLTDSKVLKLLADDILS